MSEQKFRVGAAYRNGAGEIVVIRAERNLDVMCWEERFPGHVFALALEDGDECKARGYVSLTDGRYCGAFEFLSDPQHILPGELTLKDGEWVAVEEAKPADAGLTTADAPKVFYDEGWNAAHDGLPCDAGATRDWRDGWNDYHDAGPEHKVRLDGELGLIVRQALTSEPKRPALDWNKTTPFDPFKGYVTLSSTTHQETQPKSALTTLGDPGDFKHASAFLKG